MKIRVSPAFAGRVIGRIMRLIGATLRYEIEDRSRLTDPTFIQPTIWTFWHNRMFVIPLLDIRFCPHRTGAALTSASGDGAVIAAVMHSFGLRSVRGSSSRRGATALRELAAVLKEGIEVAVTPDGPRGPCYKMGPGVIFLAQQTGNPVQPIHVAYARALRLKTWDRFMIPLPFSRVRIVLDNLIYIAPEADPETERARLEKLLQPEDT